MHWHYLSLHVRRSVFCYISYIWNHQRSIFVAEFGSLHGNSSKSTVFMDQVRWFLFYPLMAKDFSIQLSRMFLQTNVLAVGSSLGMKKISDRIYGVGSKIRGCWGRVSNHPPHHPLSKTWHIFLMMKMILNLRKFWYEVRKYQDEVLKNVSWQYNQIQSHSDHEVIKFYPKWWNNKDFDPFFARNQSKFPIEDKYLIQ